MGTALQSLTNSLEAPGMLPVVTSALSAHSWKYEIIDNEWVRFSLVGENSSYDLTFLVDERRETLTLRISSSYRVNEQLHLVVSDFLNRVNCRLRIGSFQLDDGEVIFRAGIDVEGGTLVPKMVDSLIDAGMWAYDWYYPGLMRVIYCLHSPDDAIRSLSPNNPLAA